MNWNSINNERFLRSSSSSNSSQNTTSLNTLEDDEGRQLKAKVPEYCPEFKFEFAIDGKITSWDHATYMEHNFHAQRVVEIIKIAEDSSITGGTEKEVEFAFRITGCKNEKTMDWSHIYWA